MEKLSKVWDNASKAHSKLEKITEGLLLSPANTDFDTIKRLKKYAKKLKW